MASAHEAGDGAADRKDWESLSGSDDEDDEEAVLKRRMATHRKRSFRALHIATAAYDIARAQAARDKELPDYTTTHFELSESIGAVEKAIAALERQMSRRRWQRHQSAEVSAEAKASLVFLLALSAALTPETNAYEVPVGVVFTIRVDLHLKFKEERPALEKTELATKSDFEMLKQWLTTSFSKAR